MLMHDYVGGGGGWLYGDISKWGVLQRTKNKYLLYTYVITIASISFLGFPLDLSLVVLLKHIICMFHLSQRDFFKQLLVRNELIFNQWIKFAFDSTFCLGTGDFARWFRPKGISTLWYNSQKRIEFFYKYIKQL